MGTAGSPARYTDNRSGNNLILNILIFFFVNFLFKLEKITLFKTLKASFIGRFKFPKEAYLKKKENSCRFRFKATVALTDSVSLYL